MTESFKTYLGDGAYASFDGFQILLTTEDGIRTTNTVALEPDVYKNLLRFHAKLKERFEGQKPHAWDF